MGRFVSVLIGFDMATNLTPAFTESQLRDLAGSGITPEIAAAAGWYCERDPKKIQALLLCRYPEKRVGECLVIPYFAADGSPMNYHRLKPAKPLAETKNGKQRKKKYMAPWEVRPHAFFPPSTRKVLSDPSVPLIVTEGEKKALCASEAFGLPCIGISGVDSWRAKGDKGKPLPELRAVAWGGRQVSIVYDSDLVTNPDVLRAEGELAKALMEAGAVVKLVRLPQGGAK